MKVRQGFVSNSSSSSFIIATKIDSLEDSFKVVVEGIQTSADFPMKELFIGFAEQICEAFVNNAQEMTLDEWLDEHCSDESEFEGMCPEIYDKVKNHGWRLWDGSMADDDYDFPAAIMLVNEDINYKDDYIIIEKEGGY